VDIDLETGEKIPFYDKFNLDFFRGRIFARIEDTQKDVYWFYDGDRMLRYDFGKGESSFLNFGILNRYVINTCFTDEDVWFGVSNGLWQYHRATGYFHLIENCPSTNYTHIKIESDGKVRVDYRYLFDPAKKHWTLEKTLRGISFDSIDQVRCWGNTYLIVQKGHPCIYISNENKAVVRTVDCQKRKTQNDSSSVPLATFLRNGNLSAELPYVWLAQQSIYLCLDTRNADIVSFHNDFFENKYFTTGTEIWACGYSHWHVFSKNTRQSRQLVSLLPNQIIYDLVTDAQYLYVLTSKGLSIINKHFFFERYTIEPNHHTKLEQLKRVIDSIQSISEHDWRKKMIYAQEIKATFIQEADPEILQTLNYIFHLVIPKKEQYLRDFIQMDGVTAEQLDNAYRQLCLESIVKGNLVQAKKWSNELQLRLPNAPFILQSEIPRSLEITLNRFDSIEQTNLLPDEKMWRNYEIMSDFCYCCDEFIDEACGYDQTLSDSILRRFTVLFPKSIWADNVAYALALSGCDVRDGSNIVANIENFLRLYPDSELRAEALCQMARSNEREEAKLRQSIAWLEQAEALKPELFKEDAFGQKQFKQDLQKQLDAYEIDFSIKMNEPISARGPVSMTFTLLNKSSKAKTFESFAKNTLPNFSITLQQENIETHHLKPVMFEPDREALKKTNATLGKNIHLRGKGIYQETWDIGKIILKEGNSYYGRYILEKNSHYVVKAFFLNGFGYEKSSNELRFELKN
jgi:hypothetical protein